MDLVIFFSIFFGSFLLIDLYVYQLIKTLVKKQPIKLRKKVKLLWFLITWALISTIYFFYFFDLSKNTNRVLILILFIFTIIKIFMLFAVFTDDIKRLIQIIYRKLMPPKNTQNHGYDPGRSKFIMKTGLVIGALPILPIINGMVNSADDYQLRFKKIFIDNLPDIFAGLKIVQISDLHCGTYFSDGPLKKAVKMIEKVNPEMILVTGDVVNDQSKELLPYIDVLKAIKAPLGVFSVLGNHDYGDYYPWPNEAIKKQNFNQMIALQKKIGWRLLRNENMAIESGNKKIILAGCENWSHHSRFAPYGDINKTLAGTGKKDCVLLLTHDPSHWRQEVLNFPQVKLTFSGHTHGFQFGINTPRFQWSPVQYLYKEWAGLYREKMQYLYVNVGLGCIGFPGRVGMLPEITCFTLYPNKQEV